MSKGQVEALIKFISGHLRASKLPPLRLPLTESQIVVLNYIKEYVSKKLYPPTIREICDGTGLNNPGQVQKILVALDRKGWIVREGKRTRALWVIGREPG